MIYQGQKRYPVTEAILHCAAIATGQFAHMRPFQVFATINRWHVERGFSGFGYHALIMPDGQWYDGRPFTRIGAHCIERNRGSLGILLIESRQIDRIGRFDDWFTSQQALALQARLRTIDGLQKVSGHNDYARKLCPGFIVNSADWLAVPAMPARGDNFVRL